MFHFASQDIVMTHVPLCITGYRSLVALNLSAAPFSYWWRFGSRQGHTTVTARANRATHWSAHVQAYVYEHVHTKDNIVLQILAASRCDYGTLSLTNKQLYRQKLYGNYVKS
jgi:hypothetical protein